MLKRAAAIRTIESLRFVVPYLDQPEFAQEACATVVELAHHRELREPNKAEFDGALDSVIRISKDPGVVDRGKALQEGANVGPQKTCPVSWLWNFFQPPCRGRGSRVKLGCENSRALRTTTINVGRITRGENAGGLQSRPKRHSERSEESPGHRGSPRPPTRFFASLRMTVLLARHGIATLQFSWGKMAAVARNGEIHEDPAANPRRRSLSQLIVT